MISVSRAPLPGPWIVLLTLLSLACSESSEGGFDGSGTGGVDLGMAPSAGGSTGGGESASSGSTSSGSSSSSGGALVGSGGVAEPGWGSGGVVGATGGQGTGGVSDKPIPPATFATAAFVFEKMQPSCQSSPCHGNVVPPLMGKTDTYERLLNTVSEGCENLKVVEPGHPELSALVRLLKGPCGEIDRMPGGCIQTEQEDNCVPSEYVQAIELWIANGAPKD